MTGIFRRRRGLFVKIVLLVSVFYTISLFAVSKKLLLSTNHELSKGVGKDRARPREVVVYEKEEPKVTAAARHQLSELPNAGEALSESRRDNVVNKVPNVIPLKIQPLALEPPKDVVKEEPEHDPNGPGENGQGINIDNETLSEEDKKKFDEGWKKNAYNQFASDMMSLHRSLPDVRDQECLNQTYKSNLPDTSVVICFHNEAWSVLLRTVHSVIDRSPRHLLKEIILVDDFSEMDHLKKPLEDYVAKLDIVKIVRLKQREGLIRARMAGFAAATAEVVTFLDSHCECTQGWLEPLLDRIAANETIVVCPVIDVISDSTFKYQHASAKYTYIGGFDWSMKFTWHGIPEYERQRRGNDIAPARSPTMAGGLFAINRKYFEKLGTYDHGMDIWGGENLELSFRVWMCGGSLEIVPCSRVGHIFRKRFPYSWGNRVHVIRKNSIRLAEVWLDEYKNYFYERFNYDLGEYGDVSARKGLRKNLNCKSFDWYLKNVYPDLFVPGDALVSGEIRSKAKPMCFDGDINNMDLPVKMWQCHNKGGNQYWMLSKSGEIRRDEGCLDYSGGEDVIIHTCHSQKGNQEWIYKEDNTLFHVNAQKCAEVSVDGKKLTMKTCTGIDRQLWYWKRKTTEDKDHT